MAGLLLKELKQTRPFRSRAEEAALNLIRTADLLKRASAELLRAHDLTSAQYNVLRILRGALNERDERKRARTCGDIGARLVTYEPDVTRLLDKLVKQGLVERERDDQDRRVVHSRITRKGLDLLARLDEPSVALLERRLGRLGQDRLAALIELLEAIRQD
jgi:DNA-binding MarR family transcriptional regulator